MHKAEQQQRGDAAELLKIAIHELEEYVKLYTRLKNNADQYVERTNAELALLTLLITQKQQNVQTLERTSVGFFVDPAPPVATVMQKQADEKAPGEKAPDPNGTANGVHGAAEPAPKEDDDAPRGRAAP